MVNTSNKHGGSVADVIGQAFDGSDSVLVVNPAAETVADLVDVTSALADRAPKIQVLATDRELKEAFEDFLVASSAADLCEAGVLSLRTTDLSHNTLLVTGDVVFALVIADEHAAALSGVESTFVADVDRTYRSHWDEAAQFQLRTPAISRVRETLEREVDVGTREDFDNLLAALETMPAARSEIGEVTVSLLVAARNDVLLYDISRWGEDVGIASKATFSRTKSRLEELDLIDTEKVPIDVGRPRLRLQLTDRLRGASIGELLETVHSDLAE